MGGKTVFKLKHFNIKKNKYIAFDIFFPLGNTIFIFFLHEIKNLMYFSFLFIVYSIHSSWSNAIRA